MSLATFAVGAWFVLVVIALRVMALARRADEEADLHWEELAALRSESGMSFFPTRAARRDLELAIRDLIGAAL